MGLPIGVFTPPETKELATRAHGAAQRGRTTEAYGELIATCAGCHEKLGISPK